jgi:hypothetical protein
VGRVGGEWGGSVGSGEGRWGVGRVGGERGGSVGSGDNKICNFDLRQCQDTLKVHMHEIFIVCF